MPLYESVFIARQDISATQADALADQFVELVKENGGDVPKKEYWGLKNLQYRIKKNRKGHYVLLNIEAPSAAVLEMERNMRINEDVIRYLTVRVEDHESEPSIMMRSKGGRDDRGGRGGRRGFGDRFGGRQDDRRGPREDRAPRSEASTQGEAPAGNKTDSEGDSE